MYFITCLDNLEIDALGLLGDSRCFGYFSTYQRAKEALEINECDMWEAGCYNYAVIERIESGVHPQSKEMSWWKFDHEKRAFSEIHKPEEIVNEECYALG
jgi:hypothetical protein